MTHTSADSTSTTEAVEPTGSCCSTSADGQSTCSSAADDATLPTG